MDGVEVSVTTSKIITDNDTKNEEMRFLRYLHKSWLAVLCKYYVNTLPKDFRVKPDCVDLIFNQRFRTHPQFTCVHVQPALYQKNGIKTQVFFSLSLCRHLPISPLFPLSRRQELRELRLLQKEEQRAQQQLSNKLQQQKEQIYRRFEQETTVSHSIPKCQGWE